MATTENDDAVRRKSAISDYRKKLLNHKELEGRVRSGFNFLNPIFLLNSFFSRICKLCLISHHFCSYLKVKLAMFRLINRR